jgi:hypothetical protein
MQSVGHNGSTARKRWQKKMSVVGLVGDGGACADIEQEFTQEWAHALVKGSTCVAVVVRPLAALARCRAPVGCA